ncbi:putative metal dependent phosphohydrolase [Rosellinia necatrix]|uniref:Putative metal dependent phosphohydrolase n=1 Tax=Rosellinia necatrix TaxID=77044 RepID=A0A1W2TNZ5_ROSNE|nr:putative metal dependent phosphohydrolase [Rosellinia necatrix]
MADFTGPRFPADPWGDPAKQRAPAGEEEGEGAVITIDEFREVVGAFPYAGFGAEASKAILCGLCRDKPGSTFDNFVGAFGRAYGLDGEGRGREEYTAMWARATDPANVVGNFDYLQGLLGENKEG